MSRNSVNLDRPTERTVTQCVTSVLLRAVLVTLAWVVAFELPASRCHADEIKDPVEAGKKALRGQELLPWYDAEKDALKRINVRPDDTPPSTPTNTTPTNWSLPDWLGEGIAGLLQLMFYTLLFGIIVAIIVFLVRAFLKNEAKDAQYDSGRDKDVGEEIDRVESLPFQLAKPRGDLLAEARRLYEAGDFRGAIIYLFSYQLVQLDKHQRIQLTRGKTNRQYLREVRKQPQMFRLLETTMVAFEDVFFGHYDLERSRFETCWRGLDEFHQLIQQGGANA